MEKEDLIIYKSADQGIYSGGFSVKNHFLKNGIPPLMTLNKNQTGGSSGKVSDLFDSLVIPLPLYSQYMGGGRYNDDFDEDDENTVVSDELHSKLLSLVSKGGKQKNRTRRFRNSNNKSKKR
jgi:hypothetical protein